MPLISSLAKHFGLDSGSFESQAPLELKVKPAFDISHTGQIRVVLSKPQKTDISSLISLFSAFGEVQSVDVSTHQVDSSVSVSYFDYRAASAARTSLVSTPGVSLAEPLLFPSFSRSVSVFSDQSDCRDFLHSIFERFGEIESIDYSSGQYLVNFFDIRAPLSIKRAIASSGESIDWKEQVIVSSEQLISLLLLGSNPVMETSPKSLTPDSRSSKQTNEFIINLREIDSRTTVMIRNIPKSFSQSVLVELLTRKLPPNTFDFVYLPMDLMNGVNVGYAFVNLRESNSVVRVFNLLNNKTWRLIVTQCSSIVPESSELHKACKVSYGRIQGLKNLMLHFKSSSIMNQPDSIRPYFIEETQAMPW